MVDDVVLSAVAGHFGWASPFTYFGVTTLSVVVGGAVFRIGRTGGELRASCVFCGGMCRDVGYDVSNDFRVSCSDPDLFGRLWDWIGSFGEG